ncbi:MAG TPA: glycosyltransferase family 2 protein [Devosiaceae bacterium]|nr:glycosyltransferase family 2 protein [Devosiaceae bacterium]
MQDQNTPRVSVVIPSFNAAQWINKTLQSAQFQTVEDIEIIVVDDGSVDDTAYIVQLAAMRDNRIRLIRQPNGGVARARNTGIAAARAAFIAPLDADDLWHPARLEKHLAAFETAGEDIGVVYSPFVRINDGDEVGARQYCSGTEGDIFYPHLVENFVGNGSGITVRTSIAREIGGYSFALRDQTAQGYEDWLFQLKAAHKYKFLCVPLYLIGYRNIPANMSSDYLQMARSNVLAIREVEAYAADVPRLAFWWPQARACALFVFRLAKSGQWSAALGEFARETARNPLVPFYLPVVIAGRVYDRTGLRRLWHRKKRQPTRFDELDPTSVLRGSPTISSRIWLAIYKWLGDRRRERQPMRVPAVHADLASKSSSGLAK